MPAFGQNAEKFFSGFCPNWRISGLVETFNSDTLEGVYAIRFSA